MKNRTLLSLLFLFVLTTLSAQEKRYELYSVGFYNLENLFDTIHDKGKNDFEFLPDGANKWGTLKYTNKVKNMAKVLNEMGTDVLPVGMAAVGVSEIENSRVLKDLVEHEILAPRVLIVEEVELADKLRNIVVRLKIKGEHCAVEHFIGNALIVIPVVEVILIKNIFPSVFSNRPRKRSVAHQRKSFVFVLVDSLSLQAVGFTHVVFVFNSVLVNYSFVHFV